MPPQKNNIVQQKTAICLPTFNEAYNLPVIVGAIQRILPDVFIVVIDDNSPDYTGLIADRLADKNTHIKVLHRRSKSGLGRAYYDGFHFAMDQLHADLIVQMDADFSHDPRTLPLLISASVHADLVIGSRYVTGGEIENWSLARQLISRFGSLYARKILNLPIYDPTGGFKIWHKELLQEVLKQPIASGGYVFQVETTFYAYIMGASITEVPIRFVERKSGKSKMTASIAFEAFHRILMLRLRTRNKI